MSLTVDLLIILLVAICSAEAGYTYEHNAAKVREQAAVIDSAKRATEQANQIAAEDAEILAGQEKTRIERRTVYRTLEKERIEYVEKHPDVRNCGLDADGLRQWNDANAGVLGAGVRQPQSAAAGIAAGGQRIAPRSMGEPPGSDGDIPRLGRPLPPPGAGN